MRNKIFIATHDYDFVKELELSKKKEDALMYHSLYKENEEIKSQSVENLNEISNNVINDTFDSLVGRALGFEWED